MMGVRARTAYGYYLDYMPLKRTARHTCTYYPHLLMAILSLELLRCWHGSLKLGLGALQLLSPYASKSYK